MVLMTLEIVPPSLRGGLTKWLTEVSTGVYVGNVNAMVRDLLWEKVLNEVRYDSRAVMVYTTNNEQGYAIKMWGDSKRKIVDLDGLQLVAHQHSAWEAWCDGDDDPSLDA